MERGMQIKDGLHKVGWETSDFPIACTKCLGLNPYLRMLKMDYGRDCKVFAYIDMWKAIHSIQMEA